MMLKSHRNFVAYADINFAEHSDAQGHTGGYVGLK
jgi:hypothetical protein